MFRNILVLSAAMFLVAVAAGCGGSNKQSTGPDAAVCTPTSCLAEGKECGAMLDGCGNVLQCGSCSGGEICGGGGEANECGSGTCTPTTCTAEGKECGRISDECASVLDCGVCTLPETCGGGGVPNMCGTSTVPDGGTPGPDAALGQCDPTCMAQAGAVCCRECGCTGTVRCYPECGDFTWDCEMGCCYDYQTHQCV